jgi:hypothetical protein
MCAASAPEECSFARGNPSFGSSQAMRRWAHTRRGRGQCFQRSPSPYSCFSGADVMRLLSPGGFGKLRPSVPQASNDWVLKHPTRIRPLKLSQSGPCMSLPGSMYCTSMRAGPPTSGSEDS